MFRLIKSWLSLLLSSIFSVLGKSFFSVLINGTSQVKSKIGRVKSDLIITIVNHMKNSFYIYVKIYFKNINRRNNF